MNETVLHRIDGAGSHRSSDEPFHPETFERAAHGMQELVLSLVRREKQELDDMADPDHEADTNEDGRPVLRVADGTTLQELCELIPRHWDVSVVVDDVMDNSYCVYTHVDCGGGIRVYAKIFVQDALFHKFDVGYTKIHNPEEIVEFDSYSIHASSRDVAHLIRTFEGAVEEAYAATIDSAATAFDYLATKGDATRSGGITPRKWDDHRTTQKEWAETRGKTQQTVSDNVRAAQQELIELPEPEGSKNRAPALAEIDPDDEVGDVRLV